MKKTSKINLSVLNSLLLFAFLIIIMGAVFLVSYLNTQKVINKNIDDYFSQSFSFVKYVVKNQHEELRYINYDIANLINNYDEIQPNKIENSFRKIENINNLDIIYYKTKDEVFDFSNSLFQTKDIMQKALQNSNIIKSTILSVNYKNKQYVIMLDSKKIIDENIGRVKGTLYTGKILNNNFSFVNAIKNEAKLNVLYIYFDNEKIASSDLNGKLDIDISKNKTIKADKIFVKKTLKIAKNKRLDFILVSKNSSFEILKSSFLNQLLYLIIIIILIFILLYFLSNKYIIKPFKRVVNYADDIKKYDDIYYQNSNVKEFDEFAYKLKDIISELKELKEKYSRAINGVQDGLWDIDIKRKKIYYSKRFKTMLGYKSNENLSFKTFWQRNIHKEDYKTTVEKLRKHLDRKTTIFENEYRFKCKNGEYKWIKIRGKVFFDSNNEPSRITGFHTNINDLVELRDENSKKEQMLYQQSKLASMGEMIGNIAHQWRQPLTVISVLSSTMNMQLQLGMLKDEETKKDLDKIQDTVNYLSSIIDKFRNFFNPNNKKEEFYLMEVFTKNIEIFESTYKPYNIELNIDVSDDIKLNGFKFELMQVVLNIINNAKDALVQNIDSKKRRVIFIKALNFEEYIQIKIYDNAGGIPKKIKEKIFEPYFTTKHKSQGTGLGLYMSNEIIQNHFKGQLINKTVDYMYENENMRGEEFTLTLPK
ncbi:MAG: PAS domain-containing protein [Campylobacterota bacterium]